MEPVPSTSKAALDEEIFKRPLAPAPKRRRVATEDDPPFVPNNTTVINLLADVEQAKAVAEWQSSRRKKHRKYCNDVRQILDSLTNAEITDGERRTDVLIREIVSKRRFGGTYVHLCVDSLIANVEIRDNPSLADSPVGVCHKKIICSVNVIAHDQGVKPEMPVNLAQSLCPNLVIIKCNFDKYNKATLDMKKILRTYDSHAVVSMNYADVNLSDYFCQNGLTIEMLEKAEEGKETVLTEMNRKIFQKTGLKAYIGVGPTPLIAKLASLLRRPFGTFVVPQTRQAIDSFLHGLPVTQFCGINSKVETLLKDLRIQTTDEIWRNRGALPYLVSERTMQQLLCVCLGCVPESIGLGIISQCEGFESVTYAKWLYGSKHKAILKDIILDMCLKLEQRMREVGVFGKVVMLRLSMTNTASRKKSFALAEPTNKASLIFGCSLRIVAFFFADEPNLLVNGIRISVLELSPAPQFTLVAGEGAVISVESRSGSGEPTPSTSAQARASLEAGSSGGSKKSKKSSGKSKKSKSGPGGKRFKASSQKNGSTTTGPTVNSNYIKNAPILNCPVCDWKLRTWYVDMGEAMMSQHVNRCLIDANPELSDD